ncbi:MAG: nucleotidyltransferase family protein [Comamonas sp.]
MPALCAARSLQLTSWCIGAGAVRNLVWDHLHGYTSPTFLSDIDLAYFDQDEAPGHEQQHQARIMKAAPGYVWEVTNQACVHLWFESHFGHPVAPLRDLVDAVASWPEFATSVGISLHHNDRMEIIAPLGLDDLFDMRIRRNPARVSLETFRHRNATKRYTDRWPKVRVEES